MSSRAREGFGGALLGAVVFALVYVVVLVARGPFPAWVDLIFAVSLIGAFFTVVIGLVVAAVALIRSLNRQAAPAA